MVDKKDTKIRAIHKGITIPTDEEEVKVADPIVVKAVEHLLDLVKTCVITEVVFVGVGDDTTTIRSIVGRSKHPFILSKQLEVANMLYNEDAIYPILLGEEHYEDLED